MALGDANDPGWDGYDQKLSEKCTQTSDEDEKMSISTETHVDKAVAWDMLSVKNRRIKELEAALRAQQRAEDHNANCPECNGEGDWAECGPCSELFGDAIDLRTAALSRATPS